MVHCIKLKNGKCSYTGGRCIVKKGKIIEDFIVCPQRKLAKDYNEMTMEEKAFHNSIENKKKIEELEKRINELHSKPVISTPKKVVSLPPPDGIAVIRKGLDSVEKNGGFWNWLKRKK